MINQIINRKLLEVEVFNYFKYNEYKRKLITNKTIEEDYFEEAAILGLKNILQNKYDYTFLLEKFSVNYDNKRNNELENLESYR